MGATRSNRGQSSFAFSLQSIARPRPTHGERPATGPRLSLRRLSRSSPPSSSHFRCDDKLTYVASRCDRTPRAITAQRMGRCETLRLVFKRRGASSGVGMHDARGEVLRQGGRFRRPERQGRSQRRLPFHIARRCHALLNRGAWAAEALPPHADSSSRRARGALVRCGGRRRRRGRRQSIGGSRPFSDDAERKWHAMKTREARIAVATSERANPNTVAKRIAWRWRAAISTWCVLGRERERERGERERRERENL